MMTRCGVKASSIGFLRENLLEVRTMAERSGRYVFGIILILLGVILLLPSLIGAIFNWDNLWPFFVIVAGLAFLAGWARTRGHDPGMAFVGTGTLLSGAFLGLFAWNILSWSQLATWWPVFPCIGGLSFLALWAAGEAKQHGLLIPAMGGLLTGVVGLGFTKGYIEGGLIADWWPAALILLGLIVLISRFGGGKEE
jgi:hypothetical protein